MANKKFKNNDTLDSSQVYDIGRSNTLNNLVNDTGWITLNADVKYRKIGKLVCIIGWSQSTFIGGGAYTVVGTLPVGYRPSIYRVPFTFNCIGGDCSKQCAYVYDKGTIELYLPDSTENWGFSVCYFAD